MEDKKRKEKHEAVVARERLTVHELTVEVRGKTTRPVPGGQLLRPAVFAFHLNLDAGEYRCHQAPEQHLGSQKQEFHETLLVIVFTQFQRSLRTSYSTTF